MKLRLLALAALATVGTAPAHAAADSSASFTNITFQLFDLDGAGVGDTPTNAIKLVQVIDTLGEGVAHRGP